MKLHILKMKEKYLTDILYDDKTFEIHKNDCDYQIGDLIHFVEINGEQFENNEKNLFEIIYVLKDVPEYGFDKDYCILSIKKLETY